MWQLILLHAQISGGRPEAVALTERKGRGQTDVNHVVRVWVHIKVAMNLGILLQQQW